VLRLSSVSINPFCQHNGHMGLIFEDIGPVGVCGAVSQQIEFEPLLGRSYAFGDSSDDGLLISVHIKGVSKISISVVIPSQIRTALPSDHYARRICSGKFPCERLYPDSFSARQRLTIAVLRSQLAAFRSRSTRQFWSSAGVQPTSIALCRSIRTGRTRTTTLSAEL